LRNLAPALGVCSRAAVPKKGTPDLTEFGTPTTHHLDSRAGSIAERIAHLPDDALLNTAETASWLDVSAQFLSIGRNRGYGPPFVRLSPTAVRYRIADVRAWLAERTFVRTAEFTGGKGLSDKHRAAMRAGWAKRRERLEAEAAA
jgi:predicted DNA-binding transcriptional regulator AlpA